MMVTFCPLSGQFFSSHPPIVSQREGLFPGVRNTGDGDDGDEAIVFQIVHEKSGVGGHR